MKIPLANQNGLIPVQLQSSFGKFVPQVNRFEALSKFHLSQEMGDMTVHLYNKTNPVLGEFFLGYNKKGTGREVLNRTVPWRRMFPRLGPLGPEIQQASDQCRISNLHDPPQSTRQGLGKKHYGREETSGDFLWKNLGKDLFQSKTW